MDTELRECIICGSVDGENKDGVLVRLQGEICNICREMIPMVAEKYRVDFQQRLGQKVSNVVPYPLFKTPHFTFPPYSDVYKASSYMDQQIRFAVGLGENCLVGGRRSHQSLVAELEHEEREIAENLEGEIPPDEREVLEFRKRQIETILEKRRTTKKKVIDMKMGYRPEGEEEEDDRYKSVRLHTIPYRDLDTPQLTDKGNWIKVKIPYRRLKTGFWGSKKWTTDEIYWLISKEARPFLEELSKRIRDAE
jgi:hypothetical protein